MSQVTNDQLLEAFQWRYATKNFDRTKKIPAETWRTLEQALVLSPSSYGLQPYRFLVVTDPATRAELKPQSWNQSQIVDASHLVVFAARTKVSADDVTHFMQRISAVRNVPVDSLKAYQDVILGDVVNGARGAVSHDWAARQAYIAFGNLMTTAALLGVDACPLEGLDPKAYDRILGLEGSGYSTIAACALGYRAAGDKYAGLPKVRFETSELITQV